jgi:hypothetical protein
MSDAIENEIDRTAPGIDADRGKLCGDFKIRFFNRIESSKLDIYK